jgi:glycosyltransferase involved in cell wall biosynthesis
MVEYGKLQSAPRVTIPGVGITVMMATFNGADTLGLTLNALTRIQSPPGGWKLVIVDDGSADDSRRIATSFMGRLPLTLIECSHGGKNAALNAGLSAIEGNLVVFIDDDVLPEEDWLLTFRDIADREPGYAVFGGAIRPEWEREPPQWVRDIVRPGPVWGLVERDEGRCYHSLAFGGNMAVRAEIFRRGYRFNENVGPNGQPLYRIGSETELQSRLYRDGYETWHCPRAVVRHIISESETSEDWILRRAERFGRGQSAIGYDVPGTSRIRIGGVPVDLIASMAAHKLRAIGCGLVGLRQRRLAALWDLRFCLGIAHERRLAAATPAAASPVVAARADDAGAPKTVSVVISNHNYADFVGIAIRSALDQTEPVHEVIVVDDGSTDNSREVLEVFQRDPRIHVIFQKNQGQASAINRGFAASHGDIVIFLDADDTLKPDTVSTVLGNWQPGASQCQFALEFIDADGKVRGLHPLSQIVEYGDVFWKLLVAGQYRYMPTSGHAFSRHALAPILPMPVHEWRLCADTYLVTASTAYGPIVQIPEPLGYYRLHGQNRWYTEQIDDDRMRVIWRQHLQVWSAMATVLAKTEADGTFDETERLRRANARLYLLRRIVMGSLRDRGLFTEQRRRQIARRSTGDAWRAPLPFRRRVLYAGFFASAWLAPGRQHWLRRWMAHPQTRPATIRNLVDRLKGDGFYDWMTVASRPSEPKPFSVDKNLAFGIGHEIEPHLGHGWERSLINSCVIVGASAALIGAVPENCSSIEVSADVTPRLLGPIKRQRIEAFANGTKVFEADLAESRKIKFTIPKTALRNDRYLELSFRCPDFVIPRLVDESSGDTKPQGYMFRWIRFHPIAGAAKASHPCLPVGQRVDFAEPDSMRFLDTGWAAAPGRGARLTRRFAALRFSIMRGGAHDHIVTLTFDPEMRRGLKRSTVRVLCGDIEIGRTDLTVGTKLSVLVPTAFDAQYWVNNPYGIDESHGRVHLTVVADHFMPDVDGDEPNPETYGPCLRSISLQRANLPAGLPHFVPGQAIELKGPAIRKYLVSGWQTPGTDCTYTADVKARLRGVCISEHRDIALSAIVSVPSTDGPFSQQSLSIVCNGQTVARYRLSERSEVTALIPAELVGPDRLVELDFCSSVIGRPADFGIGTDNRILGVGVESITLQ